MIEIKTVAIDYLIGLTKDESGLSFCNLYKELQSKMGSNGLSSSVYNFVCERINEIEKNTAPLSLDNIQAYQEAIELVYSLSNPFSNKEDVAWAMATPNPSTIIAGTPYMYELLGYTLVPTTEQDTLSIYKEIEWPNSLLYGLVLERLYGMPVKARPLIFEYVNKHAVKKYVELKVDFSLVSVTAKSDLPVIDFSCVRQRDILTHRDIQPLLDSIHLDNFCFEGISIVQIEDCTEKFIMESIQLMIANLSSYNRSSLYAELSQRITSILDHPAISSSLFPILTLNGVPILKQEVSENNLLFRDYQEDVSQSAIAELYDYIQSPSILSYGVHPDFDTTIPEVLHSIKKEEVKSYICCPLQYHDKVVGFVELYARESAILTPAVLTRLSPFFPILTQLSSDLGLEFKNRLDTVILQNFTALQPAVQWRFNQSAALHLKKQDENGDAEISVEAITFKDVYPLYGLIDVKDSTLLRNLAFRKDNKSRLNRLKQLIEYIPQESYPDTAALRSFLHQISVIENWLLTDRMVEFMPDITTFFQVEVPTFVLTLPWLDPKLDKELDLYAKELGKDPYQESFELSLQMVNTTISKELEKLNNFVQDNFPSYFEKFRTDGLDYDIYVGQSISPYTAFDQSYLRLFRKQQIISMVHICHAIQDLQASLPIAMSTTQLIFVHSTPIDLSFRADERRFDVEGSYNIRYHMIKKRIDKVLVKGTNQRLVQPGMIAIVVHGNQELFALIDDLYSLADKGLISQNIEMLELDELQGISGLIALRVRVCLASSLAKKL